MKKTLAAIGITFVLGACSDMYPQTPDALKSFASTSPLFSTPTYAVQRSPSAVANSLRSLSRRCLNRTTKNITRGQFTQFGQQTMQLVTKWETSVRNTHNGTELSMRMIPIAGGLNEPKEGYFVFAATVQRTGGQTQVTHYTPSFGIGPFSDQVKEWANGNSRTCPDMPR